MIYFLIKLIPRRLKYFIAIDVITYATTGKYKDTIVPELTAMDAIQRYGEDHKIK